MRYLIITICFLSAQLATAQSTQYSHAHELGYISKPKTVVMQAFEARKTTDGKFVKAAKYPYYKEVTRFGADGRVTNSIEYTFDNIHAPYTDTVSLSRAEYKYNGNRCTSITVYNNDVKFIQNNRAWHTDSTYTDSVYTYTSAKDSVGTLTAVALVTLSESHQVKNIKRTDYYDVQLGEQNNNLAMLRPYEPALIREVTPKEEYIHRTTDAIGNTATAVYETGFTEYKEYLQEEYSYEYY
mgnify:CR=1 FL=1